MRTREEYPKLRTEEIKTMCEQRGMTAKDVAEQAGLTLATIYNLINGKKNPQYSTIRKLAKVFDVEPGTLIDIPEKCHQSETTDRN